MEVIEMMKKAKASHAGLSIGGIFLLVSAQCAYPSDPSAGSLP